MVEQGKWNPETNFVYVSLTQGKQLREAIAKTRVQILGEKTNSMYIAGSEDTATRAGDGSCTPGRNYVLNGRMLKIAGSDPSVGITLTSQSGSLIKLTAVNNPSQLIILLPADLTAGTYELRVTTQYAGGGKTLKTPRSMSKLITVGDDEPENPSELMYRSVQTACTGCAI